MEGFLTLKARVEHGRYAVRYCTERTWWFYIVDYNTYLYFAIFALDFHQDKVVVTKFQGGKSSVLIFRGSFHPHDICQLGPSVGRCALLEVEDGNDHSLRCVGQAPEANMNFGVKRWQWLDWFFITLKINFCCF